MKTTFFTNTIIWFAQIIFILKSIIAYDDTYPLHILLFPKQSILIVKSLL
jgi:hypothetical protein